MRQLISVFAICAILAPTIALTDSSDDTLKFYLSKSDLVILGTILNQPGAVIDEVGVPNYYCDFKVTDVLKGDATLKGKTIRVNIVRFEGDKKDHHPLIKKDAECILFLKKEENNFPFWETADFWFGVQYPSPWMARSLKRLAEEEKKTAEDADVRDGK